MDLIEQSFRWLIVATALILTCFLAFCSRLFSVFRFEPIIHEFDPWFNFRASLFLDENQFYNFRNWFDEKSWFPLGRNIGATIFPGLHVTSNILAQILRSINVPIDLRIICVFLSPIFSCFTVLATFLLSKEIFSTSVGLLAGVFIGLAPAYSSRSVAGSFDNEGVAIFAMILTFFFWIRSLKNGSVFWSCCSSLSYFYMVASWGGHVFVVNLISVHVFVLILLEQFSQRLYISFSTFYVFSLILSMQIPSVGFQILSSKENILPLIVFLLVQLKLFSNFLSAKTFKAICFVFLLVLARKWSNDPISSRFYALFDLKFAQKILPLAESVNENQTPTWNSFFFDLHILIAFFPVGFCFSLRNLDEKRIFIILYAVFSLYFAGVMQRLILIFAPCAAILSAVAVSKTLEKYARLEINLPSIPNIFVVFLMTLLLSLFTLHSTWITSNAYSSPMVVMEIPKNDGSRLIIDDFREAFSWMKENTEENARVLSWWDYGYQISAMANRTTIIDNNTWNNTQIALVGKAFASDEENAKKILEKFDVNYVLVVFGGKLGFPDDDINKFLWMVQIAQNVFPKEIREKDFLFENEVRVDAKSPQKFFDCLLYKLSFFRYGEKSMNSLLPPGFDIVRKSEIGKKKFDLKFFEEVFTTENWLVRIYRFDSKKKLNRKAERKLPETNSWKKKRFFQKN